MIFQRIKTPGIAHVAYVIGAKGEAAVIDPRRDVDEYLNAARENDLTIKYVIETHRQEDFVLGSAELARVTGARIVNGQHELFGHGDLRLEDGEEFSFAGLRLRALHTPGHTPESMCYALFIPDSPQRAWGVFTGDTLFIGETGRTDLPDPARTGENAGLLYDAVHQKLLPLGDQAQLYPAHGAGSVCGGNIADRDESTLGLERVYNPVFTMTRKEFMEAKIRERIPRPPYFATMEKLNLKGGIPLRRQPKEVKVLQPEDFEQECRRGIVIDARDAEAFAGGHIPDSLSIWAEGLPVFGGWVADAETAVYLVLPGTDEVESAVLALARIGIDGIEGVLAGGFESWRDTGMPVTESGAVAPRQLEDRLDHVRVLDVREDSEFEEEGHIPDASHMYVGYLDEHLQELVPPLDRSEPIAVTCSVGHRASLAVSILRRHGFEHVDNLLGGMTAWAELDLPMEKNATKTVTTPQMEGERA
ncbi:MAG: rhodanese-like domain-containing protein [Candidatus Binatia bacterium]